MTTQPEGRSATGQAWTPGPWEYDGRAQIVEAERPHMRIAFLPSDHAEYASSKANGYLIAAAPEMAEALRPLAFSDECNPPPGVSEIDWNHAVLNARDLLDRIRGNQ